MQIWQKRQKHHEDFQKLAKELKMLDSKGLFRHFNGSAFWPKYQELGHTSMDFNKCSCNKGN